MAYDLVDYQSRENSQKKKIRSRTVEKDVEDGEADRADAGEGRQTENNIPNPGQKAFTS